MADDSKLIMLEAALDMRNAPEKRKEQLLQLLDVAASRIRALGIVLKEDAGDVQLQVDYAAWMYRRRNQTVTTMPRWLQMDLHNRLVAEKGRVTS